MTMLDQPIVKKRRGKGQKHTDTQISTANPLDVLNNCDGSGQPLYDILNRIAAPSQIENSDADGHVSRVNLLYDAVPSEPNQRQREGHGLHDTHKPVADPAGVQSISGEDGQTAVVNLSVIAVPPEISSIITSLRHMQRRRTFALRARTFEQNNVQSFLRNVMGYRPNLPAAEANRIKQHAARIVAVVIAKPMSPESMAGDAASAVAALIYANQTSRRIKDESRLTEYERSVAMEECGYLFGVNLAYQAHDRQYASAEDAIAEHAAKLPVADFVNSISGFGFKGLGVIVAEAGRSLSCFPTPGHLWKRLGLAPPKCYAMKDKSGKTVNAIPRQRRSQVWQFANMSLLKGENVYKSMVPPRIEWERGKFKDELENESTPAKRKKAILSLCGKRARRAVEKKFIKDLWKKWNETLVRD